MLTDNTPVRPVNVTFPRILGIEVSANVPGCLCNKAVVPIQARLSGNFRRRRCALQSDAEKQRLANQEAKDAIVTITSCFRACAQLPGASERLRTSQNFLILNQTRPKQGYDIY